MSGQRLTDPWDHLRRRHEHRGEPTDSAREPSRGRPGPSPEGSPRLWAATAGVLVAVGQLVDVARELCEARAAASEAAPRPRTTGEYSRSTAPTDNGVRSEPIHFLDDDDLSTTVSDNPWEGDR